MLRIITAIVLLTALAAQTFQKAVIVLDYYTNTASFAKNCENKTRPLLRCKGKCQMMKKLQQGEKKGEQSAERKGENKNAVASSKSFFATLPFVDCKQPKSVCNNYLLEPTTDLVSKIFHPPLAV